ncbi:MAG: hypothetical protein ACK55W_10525, partial [Pseudomonadota bacterium]
WSPVIAAGARDACAGAFLRAWALAGTETMNAVKHAASSAARRNVSNMLGLPMVCNASDSTPVQ